MLSSILYTACLGTIWAALYFSSKRRRSLPPGPPGYPIIGNTLQIPEGRQWITFAEWGRKYGKIMYISALGQDTIILSSPDVVTELLENRGSMYSDRPTYHMAGELVGYGDTIVLLPNDNRLRASRKLVANVLTKRDSAVFAGIYEDKVLNFLSRLLETPKEFSEHIQLLVASAVLQISHGYNVRNVNDDFLRIARRANHEYHMSIAPGAWLVELIPQLRYIPDWVPGAGFKRKARNWRKTVEWLKNVPYDTVKTQIAQGTAQPSFTADLILANMNASPEEEYFNKCVTGILYATGTDTSVSVLESFFLAMSLYPEIQRKAQAELDLIIGPGRIPTLSNRSQLPYIDALIQEVHRWNPVAPLILPHKVSQDDTYDGYFIPANSTIIVNIWAILHDPTIYPDPMEFRPERYLVNKDDREDRESIGQVNPDPHLYAFGFGRRRCPGITVAEDLIFMAITATLTVFDIRKAIGPDGLPVEPQVEYHGTISHNVPFGCRITPRSSEIVEVVRTMGQSR